MQVTRSSEIQSQKMMGTRLNFLANPSTGATESIVIRGTVTAGGAFPAHSHDREEVLCFLSGAGTYTIDDERGSVSAGHVVVIPAGALHAFEATQDLDAIGMLPAGTRTFAPDGSEMTR